MAAWEAPVMIEKGLIVSCQVENGSSFTSDDMTSFALEAVRGGCVGLRVEGVSVLLISNKRQMCR